VSGIPFTGMKDISTIRYYVDLNTGIKITFMAVTGIRQLPRLVTACIHFEKFITTKLLTRNHISPPLVQIGCALISCVRKQEASVNYCSPLHSISNIALKHTCDRVAREQYFG
jgi:hypothetical protein